MEMRIRVEKRAQKFNTMQTENIVRCTFSEDNINASDNFNCYCSELCPFVSAVVVFYSGFLLKFYIKKMRSDTYTLHRHSKAHL